jgi:hypothetical protein
MKIVKLTILIYLTRIDDRDNFWDPLVEDTKSNR